MYQMKKSKHLQESSQTKEKKNPKKKLKICPRGPKIYWTQVELKKCVTYPQEDFLLKATKIVY
jgi:hypothetical protein